MPSLEYAWAWIYNSASAQFLVAHDSSHVGYTRDCVLRVWGGECQLRTLEYLSPSHSRAYLRSDDLVIIFAASETTLG